MSEWRQLVESLFRLYRENKVSESKILALYSTKTISKEEMAYILSASR